MMRLGHWVPASSRTSLALVLAGLALVGLAGAYAIDRTSVERANRLYRADAFAEAARIYADRLGANSAGEKADILRFDLATTLFAMEDPTAEEMFDAVGMDAGVELKVRALNNLGLWHITEAAKVLGQDRARTHAVKAVEAYKSALRLKPGYTDASWNIFIAQHLLNSIDAGEYNEVNEPVEGGVPAEGLEPPDEEASELDQEEEMEAGSDIGQGETAAEVAADAALSQEEAAAIIGTNHRDPTAMVSKLMALEGRDLRRRGFGGVAED